MKKTKEEQQGRIIPFEDFILHQVKLNKGQGAVIKYEIAGVDRVLTADCADKPHPDLVNALDELKPYYGDLLGITEGWSAFRTGASGNIELAEKAVTGYEKCIDGIKINGITYKGDPNSEKFGVSITGSFKTPSGNYLGNATPKVTFSDDATGLEEDLEPLTEAIDKEVYEYLILKKKEQANIEDQAEGFDNDGGVQMDLVTEAEQATATSGLQ